MTTRETRAALAASVQATSTYELHAAGRPHCRKRAPVCPAGDALWADKLYTARELRHQRELDRAPAPGQVALW